MTTKDVSSKPALNSIEKGFLVLESLAQFDFPVSLKLLTQHTRLPKPTLYRILQTLVGTGYVTHDSARGHYAISPKLAEVGNSRRYSALKEAALPLMDSLYRSFNETVNLGVLVGTNVQYVHVMETTKSLRWIVSPDAQDDFYCTALGRAIAAFLPEESQERLLSQVHLEQRTPKTPVDSKSLRKILRDSRENGWALDDEENAVGVVCFATPLFRRGEPIAAISVSMPKSRLTADLRSQIITSLEGMDKNLAPTRVDN